MAECWNLGRQLPGLTLLAERSLSLRSLILNFFKKTPESSYRCQAFVPRSLLRRSLNLRAKAQRADCFHFSYCSRKFLIRFTVCQLLEHKVKSALTKALLWYYLQIFFVLKQLSLGLEDIPFCRCTCTAQCQRLSGRMCWACRFLFRSSYSANTCCSERGTPS